MEARQPAEKSVEIMENALGRYKDELNSNELIELITNLAFFYQEEICEVEKAKHLLEEVIKLSPNTPNPYNALGILSLNEDNVIEALRMFERASNISEDIKYHNNYAVALYIDGQLEKAIDIFNQISKAWRENEVALKAYYSYGMAKSIKGEKTIGIRVADDLCSLLHRDDYIYASQVADLYYICKDYGKCVAMYDYEKLHPSVDWLKIYFYSLHAMDLNKKLQDTINEIIAQKKNDIEEAQNDSDEDWSMEDRRLYIEDLKKDIEDFTNLYDLIISNNYIPNFEFKPDLIYGCYLINCPRHGC
jgi:tetratricopeptide (TPR) repeat protein